MKKILSVLKVCLTVMLILGLVMIYHQNQEDKANLRSLNEAMQLAGLSQGNSVSEREIFWEGDFYQQFSGGEGTSWFAGVNIEILSLKQLPKAAAALACVQLEALQEINEEVVGWIEIPGTEISCPLCHGEDNEYYLTHSWNGEKNSSGAIFLECENDFTLESFHTIIYGHRMRSGAMFGSLKYYKDQEYWQEHPAVYLVSGNEVYRYDIFAAYETGIEDLVYQLDLTGQEEAFISFCLEKSVIDTGIIPEVSDRIITMSTCTANNHDRRWVVQGYLRAIYTESPESVMTSIKEPDGSTGSISDSLPVSSGDIRAEGIQNSTPNGTVSAQRKKESNAGTENNLEFTFGSDGDARKMVPEEVWGAVNQINAGESLAEATGVRELEGYCALTTMHVIIAKDKETGEEAKGNGLLTLYVPNLLEGLTDVSVLYYDCVKGEWKLIPVEGMDVKGKRISVRIGGSGVATTVYRMG